MATHLKKFATHAEYEAFINEGIAYWPNVSVCEDRYDVHVHDNGTIVNPSPTPSGETHEYVEIAGVKWATMNVGAETVTDTGKLFAWGDTQGYDIEQVGTDKNFCASDYKYYDSSDPDEDMTKYTGQGGDGKLILDLEDDAVNAAWGGNWKMPTNEQAEALLAATTSAFTENYKGSGVGGVVLTDNTDNTKELFFPAAGYAECSNFYPGKQTNYGNTTYRGCYWTRSLLDEYQSGGKNLSYMIHFYVDVDYYQEFVNTSGERRWQGFPVRGILAE